MDRRTMKEGQKARIYLKRGNAYYQTPFCACRNGNVYPSQITSNQPFNAAQVAGFPVVNDAQLVSISNQFSNQSISKEMTSNDYVQTGQMPAAVHQTKTTQGDVVGSRLETNRITGQKETLSITLSNTHATATQNFVLFDGAGYIAQKLGVSLNGVVTVDGTYGANTAAQIKVGTGLIPQRLETFHLLSATLTVSGTAADTAGAGTPATIATVTPSDKFFKTGKISLMSGNLGGGQPTDRLMSFQKDFRGDTYNSSVRYREEFGWIADPMSGIYVSLPALTQVTLTWDIESAATAYNMVRG